MAYIRTIKASFFTSDDIVSLSPLGRLLYIALWTEADREGRLTWRPGNFKLRFFPGDACDIRELCAELVDSGLVVTYTVDGKTYAEIPTFTRHQVINNRERKSALPARVANALSTCRDASATRDEVTGTPLVGKERKGSSTSPSQVGDGLWSECVHGGPAAQKMGNGGDHDF
jgi:hypothetical protein